MSSTFKTKIVRPNGDQYPRSKNNRVTIPFYEEYGVYVKNDLGVRRMFELLIDGESAGNGQRYILDAKQETTIWRWLEGSLNSGSKFLFLPVDHPMGQSRAERPEAGIVRVRMWTEEPEPETIIRHEHHYHTHYERRRPHQPSWPNDPWITWCGSTTQGDDGPINVTYTAGEGSITLSGGSVSAMNCSMPIQDSAPAMDIPSGVTGRGAESSQQFHTTAGFHLGSEVDEEIFFLIPPQDQATALEEGLKPEAHYCGHCKAKRKSPTHIFCPYCSREY